MLKNLINILWGPRMTSDKLRKYFPNANLVLLDPIVWICNGSEDRLIKCHMLAQLAHESDGFKTIEEYASGKAYEGRLDLGNTEAGDGQKYKGRGYIQITGRANYKACGEALRLDLINIPSLLLTPMNGLNASIWYWNSRNLDQYALKDDIKTITKRINGGLNGLSSRQDYLDLFKRIL